VARVSLYWEQHGLSQTKRRLCMKRSLTRWQQRRVVPDCRSPNKAKEVIG
jgi:hypothetical protein